MKATEIDTQSRMEVLKEEILQLKEAETETRNTLEALKMEVLQLKEVNPKTQSTLEEQDKMVSSLQELVMELCDKTDVHGGSKAYWKVKDDLS